jgi:hypothetical protein
MAISTAADYAAGEVSVNNFGPDDQHIRRMYRDHERLLQQARETEAKVWALQQAAEERIERARRLLAANDLPVPPRPSPEIPGTRV